MLNLVKRNLAGVLVAALGLTAGAAALAQAQTDDSPSTSAPKQADRPPKHGRGPMGALKGAVHGDLIVRDSEGEFVPVTFDRGTLDSVGADELTLTRPDGKQVTVKLDDETRYRGVESKDQLRTGEGVLVVSDDGVASMVGQRREGASGERRSKQPR